MLRRALLPVWFLYAVAASTTANTPISGPAAAYKVVHVYPHDSQAFTQGLIYVDGHLYESTGLNGRSSLRMEDLSTGRVLQHYDLPAQYFGEGLTDWGSTLVQLTWTSHTGFVYDRFSFSPLRTFQYKGEGWGLTHDDKQLIMSDGTSYLRFLDPKTFRETRRIHVIDESGHPVQNLNELEPFISGSENSPTAENLARYIFERLKPEIIAMQRDLKIGLVRVWESPDASAVYREV
jgi:glutamine cyclotransferase